MYPKERRSYHRGAVSQERDPVNFILGLCDYIYSAIRTLALNFVLGVNRDCFGIVPSQYQGFHDVEIDRLRGAVIQRYSLTLHTVSRLPVTGSNIL